jgi:folate-dependent phosphoribosylglycinamide formyltransferase PurN
MISKKLRVIALTHGGTEIAIKRLVELDSVELAGIFIETDVIRRLSLLRKIKRSIRYDGYAVTVSKLARKLLGLNGVYHDGIEAIAKSRDQLREIAEAHGVPVHFLDNYHSEDAMALMREAQADLGVVLGTNILKESVFKIPRLGSINLHQGLAPYYRGCPPVFWELYNGESEIGLTVHFVESKVDTGDIVLQRAVPLKYDYSYQLKFEAFISDFRRALTVPSANLVAEAVRLIAEGTAVRQPQDTSLGKRYRMPIKSEKDELRRRLRARRRLGSGYAVTHKVSSGD